MTSLPAASLFITGREYEAVSMQTAVLAAVMTASPLIDVPSFPKLLASSPSPGGSPAPRELCLDEKWGHNSAGKVVRLPMSQYMHRSSRLELEFLQAGQSRQYADQ